MLALRRESTAFHRSYGPPDRTSVFLVYSYVPLSLCIPTCPIRFPFCPVGTPSQPSPHMPPQTAAGDVTKCRLRDEGRERERERNRRREKRRRRERQATVAARLTGRRLPEATRLPRTCAVGRPAATQAALRALQARCLQAKHRAVVAGVCCLAERRRYSGAPRPGQDRRLLALADLGHSVPYGRCRSTPSPAQKPLTEESAPAAFHGPTGPRPGLRAEGRERGENRERKRGAGEVREWALAR